MQKRGQQAMEFLMSYGWALLVVLVAVAALAYFGILKPGEHLPEMCVLFPGISCTDFKVDSNQVTLMVVNGGGSDFQDVTFTIVGSGPCGGDSSETKKLDDGEQATFTITCTEKPTPGAAFKKDIRIDYTELNGLTHSKVGSISTKVEA